MSEWLVSVLDYIDSDVLFIVHLHRSLGAEHIDSIC